MWEHARFFYNAEISQDEVTRVTAASQRFHGYWPYTWTQRYWTKSLSLPFSPSLRSVSSPSTHDTTTLSSSALYSSPRNKKVKQQTYCRHFARKENRGTGNNGQTIHKMHMNSRNGKVQASISRKYAAFKKGRKLVTTTKSIIFIYWTQSNPKRSMYTTLCAPQMV